MHPDNSGGRLEYILESEWDDQALGRTTERRKTMQLAKLLQGFLSMYDELRMREDSGSSVPNVSRMLWTGIGSKNEHPFISQDHNLQKCIFHDSSPNFVQIPVKHVPTHIHAYTR